MASADDGVGFLEKHINGEPAENIGKQNINPQVPWIGDWFILLFYHRFVARKVIPPRNSILTSVFVVQRKNDRNGEDEYGKEESNRKLEERQELPQRTLVSDGQSTYPKTNLPHKHPSPQTAALPPR